MGNTKKIIVTKKELMRDAGGREWFFSNRSTGEKVEPRRLSPQITVPIEQGYFNNNFQSLMKMMVAHRVMGGNGVFWKKATTAYGEVRGVADTFIPIRPDMVKAMTDSSGLILKYYEIKLQNGITFQAALDEVIHFKQNAIFSPFWGVGNVTKARLTVAGETASEEFANEFMNRRAVPSMAISEQTSRNPDEIRRNMQLLNDKYSGAGNAGKILYMAGENIKIEQLQLSQKDIQFIEQKQFNRQTILSIFGVPPIMVGIGEGANKAISQVMRLNYLANTVNPIIEEMESEFNQQHIHRIDPTIDIKFKRQTTGDIENVKMMVDTGMITPNRASELMGEETDRESSERNTYYLPVNLVPLGFVPDSEDATNDGKSEHVHTKECVLHDPKNIEAICAEFTKSAVRPKQFQVRYLRASLASRAKMEDRFAYALGKFFEAQGKRVVERFNDRYGVKELPGEIADVSVIYSIGEENSELSKEMKKLYTSGVQRGVKDINGLTGYNVSNSLANPFVTSAIGRLGKRVTGEFDKNGAKIAISETTRQGIEKVIVKGVANELTIEEISANLTAKFKQYSGARARIIARTESAMAWDAGAEVSYKEIGVKTVDVVGCTEFEVDSDCGKQGIPVDEISTLVFHPNHIGAVVPSKEV